MTMMSKIAFPLLLLLVGGCYAFLPTTVHLQRSCVATKWKTCRSMTKGFDTTYVMMNKQRIGSTAPPPAGTETPSLGPNAPSTWDETTTPFTVVRYYARDDVTDEEIKSQLHLKGITSLEILKRKAFSLVDLLKEDTDGGELIQNVNAAMLRTQMRPTEILGGKLVFDRTCITEKLLRLYAPTAVSVVPISRAFEPDRMPNFTLVMGPSGSGKTMFALEHLPSNVFPEAKSPQEIFRVHLTARTLLKETEGELDLAALLVNHVEGQVAVLLRGYVTQVVPPIHLFLFVVIDEAGSTGYKSYFDTADKIKNLVNALHNMEKYKFVKGVHVTVTGTGLETSTDGIDPNVETIKFRMQPWSQSNFHALLTNLKRSDEATIKGIVMRYPILQSLTTNARCAYFLADSMPDLTSRSQYQWPVYVDASIVNVAQRYIASNGLSHLTQIRNGNFIVAQETFRALDEAMRQPNVAFFPNFDHIQDATFRSVTQSLLDINVEIGNGVAELVGKSKFSVSVTPAITVVLAEILCEKVRIRWNWNELETTAALGEWKRMITEMKASEFSSANGITYLRSPVPDSRAKVRFTLPLVGESTVLLNGRAAPYADLMAPFRLVQAKFSVNTQEDLHMNFEEEMDKMGLTIDPESRLQQAITSVLSIMWPRSRSSVSDDYRIGSTALNGTNVDNVRCEHYPFQTLLPGYTPVPKKASFVLDKEQLYVLPDKKDSEATALIGEKPIKVLEEFTEGRPVTTVFVTNANSFVLEKKVKPAAEGELHAANKENGDAEEKNPDVKKIPQAKKKQLDSNGEQPDGKEDEPPVTIGKLDVDWRGILKKPLPGYLVGNLRENVDVRFLFY
jgi:hypothetical protein